jgi:uroporphyrin-III C-methyltransferase
MVYNIPLKQRRVITTYDIKLVNKLVKKGYRVEFVTNGELNPEIKVATKSSGTVVILMGISKLNEIVDIYKKYGKENEAIAIIYNGSLPSQSTVVGTIDSISEIAEVNKNTGPGIIVIGSVVEISAIYNDSSYLFEKIVL